VRTKALSHRILKAIPHLGWNIVLIPCVAVPGASLPGERGSPHLVCIARYVALEALDELLEPALARYHGTHDMQMVWHDAEGMELHIEPLRAVS
jgi:hypothetical protein